MLKELFRFERDKYFHSSRMILPLILLFFYLLRLFHGSPVCAGQLQHLFAGSIPADAFRGDYV